MYVTSCEIFNHKTGLWETKTDIFVSEELLCALPGCYRKPRKRAKKYCCKAHARDHIILTGRGKPIKKTYDKRFTHFWNDLPKKG